MKAFENIEIAFMGVPAASRVLESIRRDEPCRGDPLSTRCHFAPGKDDYLLKDLACSEVCKHCPAFRRKLQQLTSEWEDWVLAMQDAYT